MITDIPAKTRSASRRAAQHATTFLQGAKTALLITLRRSDTRRWSDKNNLHSDWDERTKLLASFIAPNSKVLEFGAGRIVLPRFLPPGCTYTPSDLVDRGAGTIVCDLNAPQLPSFPAQDVALLSGVLEYVHDIPRLVSHLATFCHTVSVSYAVRDFANQATAATRRPNGWVNDYSSQELQDVFSREGFLLQEMIVWREQHLFKFVRTHVPAA